jgi:uncharacterized protein YkwD
MTIVNRMKRPCVVGFCVALLLLFLCACAPTLGNQATATQSCTGSSGATGATTEEDQFALVVFQAINHDRASNRLTPLSWCTPLANSARQHDLAMEKASTLAHQLDGEADPGDRETQQGITWTWAGENIGEAPDLSVNGAMELHKAMMDEKPPDDGHRQNILSENYTVVGVDVLLDQRNGVLWLTEDFAQLASA